MLILASAAKEVLARLERGEATRRGGGGTWRLALPSGPSQPALQDRSPSSLPAHGQLLGCPQGEDGALRALDPLQMCCWDDSGKAHGMEPPGPSRGWCSSSCSGCQMKHPGPGLSSVCPAGPGSVGSGQRVGCRSEGCEVAVRGLSSPLGVTLWGSSALCHPIRVWSRHGEGRGAVRKGNGGPQRAQGSLQVGSPCTPRSAGERHRGHGGERDWAVEAEEGKGGDLRGSWEGKGSRRGTSRECLGSGGWVQGSGALGMLG